jgi:hypothetical protein
MTGLSARASLYVLFEGERGDRRPISARWRAPRSGIKVRVAVEHEAAASARIFLLHRRGDSDMVIGTSAKKDVLEALRSRLGRSADAYEITAIPVLHAQAASTSAAP